ncbi:transglutaminase-like domain-containing protein [Candidatus Micrarchaeota archaeon]|nr:transglutaminase-like domain-containing protein [Candidatus Micrarchaeota archaeon]MBU1887315.1 transglutaminase-like domain-containing protein [Candidatus Micrarchaeota archaeon]
MKSTSAAILVLFILLLISGSFAATTYGPSRITIERTWTIDNVKDNDISFLAALAVNDSNQKIIHINVSPGVTTFQDGNDTVWLNYSGHMNKKTKVITASVMLDIYYDTQLVSDESVATSRVAYTPLTQADDGIIFQAELLNQQNSSLQTIANLANWINDNMEYDISYWGKVVPAETVFQTRKGVCVEHTHLFMSLANSLGFKTRYASGYVYANGWQPHAWTEVYVPSYGWLSVDPTLAQVGTLDNSHVLLRYGADQNSVFDSLISQNADATLSFDDSITTIFSSETPVPPPCHCLLMNHPI